MAHVIAAAEDGPRGDSSVSEEELTQIDNLILLCAVCHTLIDKDPDGNPTEVVMRWKRDHARRRRELLGAAEYSTRRELRLAVEKYLEHSRAIHELCGPESEAAQDPTSDAFDIWKREVTESLIPNNYKIIELMEANRGLLEEDEKATLAQFKVHARAFEARHLFGERSASVPRFPAAMETIAKDAQGAQ